jgi:hypothetical protein
MTCYIIKDFVSLLILKEGHGRYQQGLGARQIRIQILPVHTCLTPTSSSSPVLVGNMKTAIAISDEFCLNLMK